MVMRIFCAFVFAFALLSACSQGQPQPTLPKAEIVVDSAAGPHAFVVEIAADDASRSRGLMERTTLAPDAGMLFDYHRPQPVAFWMKNTPLPLDMIFIRNDGTIALVVPNATPYSKTPIPSMEPVRAVLEINGGRAAALGIERGGKVRGAIFGKK
mgnify:CR=1 FL=1